MIASMTGFGRAERQEGRIELTVEIRSLNNRFLDVELRAPKNIMAFEQEIKELVRSQISRGRISVTITAKGAEEGTVGLAIDKSLAAKYVKQLRDLSKELGLDDSIKLEQLLNLPDIFTVDNSEVVERNILEPLKKTLEMAIADLKTMRLREGEEIKKDLQARIDGMNMIIKNIESHSKKHSKEVLKKLKERIRVLIKSKALDEGRLETEVALLADKVDVTEECIRFKSHNALFLELMENGQSEGRKLNFLLQEMHREANTIGAKASDAQIAHWVVDIKEEVEKLREQVQNIE
jgi:uncharacterized protein (TIGR00255 family)